MKKVKLKYYAQHDSTDCAPACLKMIFKYFGTDLPLYRIRELADTNQLGTSLSDIFNVCNMFNFDCIALKANNSLFNEKTIELPFIVHTSIDGLFHYEIVYGIRNQVLYIIDPSKGKYKISLNEFIKKWHSRIIICIEPGENYEPQTIKSQGLTSFIPFLLNQKKTISLAILYSFLITFITVFNYNYWEILVDKFIPNSQKKIIIQFSLFIIVLNLFKFSITHLRNRTILLVEQYLNINITKRYFNHILTLPYTFFVKRHSGDLIARFNDSNKIINFLSTASVTVILDSITILVVGVALFSKSTLLFTISLTILPLYLIIIFTFNKRIEERFEKSMMIASDINSKIIESIEGIHIVKANVTEYSVKSDLENRLKNYIIETLSAAKFDSLQVGIKNFFNDSFTILILCIGALQVVNSLITLGDLISFYSMLGFFYTSINNLVNLQVQIQSANLASKRINDILSLPSEISGGSKLLAFEYTLNLKNISISYGKRQILSNINLLIKKNKKIAIIGESGSGKSTLAKVIANLIKVNSGEILIDDINIEKYSLESIRRLIHYVPQDLYFFKGTIRDNIILNKNTKQNDILDALSRAEISNLLEEESLGLDTIIESNGLNLSGGQKKRLAIARSLLIQAEIIIFDEITNGLSSKQEKRIISNLIELNQQTIIFLTHSELIPKYCDEVWIINNGKLTIKTN